MQEESTADTVRHRRTKHRRKISRSVQLWLALGASLVLVVGAFTLGKNPAGSTNLNSGTEVTASHVSATIDFSLGRTDHAEPSGEAPMPSNALQGYSQTYVNDFNGTSLPVGWDVFTGTASGDAGSQFGASHVVVGGGLLSLNTTQDPAYGNEWVTGGLCQCGTPMNYGAFFVRSRVTGPGPTIVELLWPLGGWPPEIDFNETDGTTDETAATDIWAANGGQNQVHLTVNMTEWHTWGVVWTPTSILYTVDGKVWGQYDDAANVPHQPMTLHLQQQTWCTSNFACPTTPQSTQVDWVTEYSPDANYSPTLGPFSPQSWELNGKLKTQILGLAESIVAQGATSVALTGYSDSKTSSVHAATVSQNRASTVKGYLRSALLSLNDSRVMVTATASTFRNPTIFTTTPTGRARDARVTARLSR